LTDVRPPWKSVRQVSSFATELRLLARPWCKEVGIKVQLDKGLLTVGVEIKEAFRNRRQDAEGFFASAMRKL